MLHEGILTTESAASCLPIGCLRQRICGSDFRRAARAKKSRSYGMLWPMPRRLAYSRDGELYFDDALISLPKAAPSGTLSVICVVLIYLVFWPMSGTCSGTFCAV